MTKWLIFFSFVLFFNLAGALSINGNVDSLILKNSIGYADYWVTNNLDSKSLLVISTESSSDTLVTVSPSSFYLDPGQSQYFTVTVNSELQGGSETLKIKASNCLLNSSCENTEKDLNIMILSGSNTATVSSSGTGLVKRSTTDANPLSMSYSPLIWNEDGYFTTTLTATNLGNDNTFKFYLNDLGFKIPIGEKILRTNEQTQLEVNYKPFGNNIWISTNTGGKIYLNTELKPAARIMQEPNQPIENKTGNQTQMQELQTPTSTGFFLADAFQNPTDILILLGILIGGILLVLNLKLIKKSSF
ncbi:Uncharacterised protein [uncultured archaeon]|nr:Uncharacterised protein [uncultured archaeon]